MKSCGLFFLRPNCQMKGCFEWIVVVFYASSVKVRVLPVLLGVLVAILLD